MIKQFVFLLAFTIIAIQSFGQQEPTLFTVHGTPVRLSEFNYIYTKTNGAKADFSKASVDEYLDLYTKFKMKVARAKDMKLDTIPALRDELAGYRRQLSDSYLTDKEVTEKLMKEAHERLSKDRKVSHVLIKIDPNDTMPAYKLISKVKNNLANGGNFEQESWVYTQDTFTKRKGGDVGFITGMLPDGFYDLETAIFTLPIGKHSDIIRSPLGYHILKVTEERPARGEIEVSHILLRKVKDGEPQPNVKEKIDSLYQRLLAGEPFDAMAIKHTDDAQSAQRNGYLGFFGIGRYELSFEDAAFAIINNGGVSKPVETMVGWHIIKRLSRKGIEPYETMKTRLKARVQSDSRYEMAKKAMITRIKKENTFKENTAVLDEYISGLDSTFLTYAWRNSNKAPMGNLFNIGNMPRNATDFAQYLIANANRRLSYAVEANNDNGKIARKMYAEFIDESAMAFEESQLETKYSDFKNLMREYEEGILLFEAIKMNVWDKASQDTVGLDKFHATRKDKYMWDERAQVITYTVSDSAKADLAKIRELAAKKNPQAVLKKFNSKKEIVSFSEDNYEKGKNKAIEGLTWKAGSLTADKQNPDKSWSFMKIEKVMSKTQKTLKEARGYVVADYQEFLEKQWMEELAKAYKVEVNQDVLKSIIK
jgi:peptidyl-prolyl cis-trans isomerase SurA